MFKNPKRIILVIMCLGAIVAVIVNSNNDEAPLFDPIKLEVATDLGAPVAISTILSSNVAFVCVLGSYQNPRFLSADIDLEILEQLDSSSVPEGVVRLSTFDKALRIVDERHIPIVSERHIPMWGGDIRTATTGQKGVLCGTVETVMVEVVEHGTYKSVRFVE